MADRVTAPDPRRIHSLDDLTHELTRLRRRAAGPGSVQLSVRAIAARTGRAPSTLDPYLRGQRLCPADTYERILLALGLNQGQLGPWLDAWERVADARADPAHRTAGPAADRSPSARTGSVGQRVEVRYTLASPGGRPAVHVVIVPGDVRRVKSAAIWVNPENTDMRMARFEEHTVSAIVRYQGATRDETGRVVRDEIDELLQAAVGDRRPVAPGTAIVTGAGDLGRTNNVHRIVHVATVQGEAGEGYRQVRDVHRCAANALAAADRCAAADERLDSILFPLLGTGVGGGEPERTARQMLGAVLDHVDGGESRLRSVFFLAYTETELAACTRVFDGCERLAGPGR